jgi:hypothetical protein
MRPDHQRMLLDVYQTSITSEQLGDNDLVNGCKLLLNLRNSINDVRFPPTPSSLSF